LRRRVRALYRAFNRADWARCFAFIDPKLRDAGRVEPATHADAMGTFRQTFGDVRIWHIDISLSEDAQSNKIDGRPFAYVYVFWQDDRSGFHVFRERWIVDGGQWYTRVVGLVASEHGSRPTRNPSR
jgi:hypothetical protein